MPAAASSPTWLETLKTFQPLFQPIGIVLAAFVAALLGFVAARLIEPFKSNVALKAKRRELRFTLTYEKQLNSLEGLNKRVRNLIYQFEMYIFVIQGTRIRPKNEIDEWNQRLSKTLKDFSEFLGSEAFYLPRRIAEKASELDREVTLAYFGPLHSLDSGFGDGTEWGKINPVRELAEKSKTQIVDMSRELIRRDDDGPIGD